MHFLFLLLATLTLRDPGFVANSGSVAVDVTPPTLSSATVDVTGLTLTLVFSEAVTGGADAPGSAFTLTGTSAGAVYVSGDGTTTLVYSLNHGGALAAETITLDYDSAASIADLADSPNLLITFADFPVTNNSTQ